MDIYSAIKNRRSIYSISKDKIVSEERIEEIINEAVLHTPSSFNSQSARVLILFNNAHDKLWEITKEALKKVVPKDDFAKTEERIQLFKNGYGSILFYEDQNTIINLQEQYALYKENFPIWSQQSSGMLQYVIWTLLEAEGLGVTLQHYNPLIDEEIMKEWHIPKEWKLVAQMPFGKPTAPPGDKEFMALNERIKIVK